MSDYFDDENWNNKSGRFAVRRAGGTVRTQRDDDRRDDRRDERVEEAVRRIEALADDRVSFGPLVAMHDDWNQGFRAGLKAALSIWADTK